jgi:molybdopterin-containing oxidoreductase family iron-sulfur binding subunit
MEKCSYCVQRIREAEIKAEVGERPIRDGDIRTACEQACPTRAIVFGDVSDASAEVTRLHHADRSFAVLQDLGTVPRTRYLAKIRNPNPKLG